MANFSGEVGFSGADLGEDKAANFIWLAGNREVRIKRQLHIVRAGKIPGVRRGVAGFVIDDEKGIVDEAIDAIEAQAKRQAGNGDAGFLFRVEHGEGNARSLEGQPLGDEVDEASLFEREIARRHGVASAERHGGLNGAADMKRDEIAEIGERDELRVRTNAARRAGPDGMQNFMQELAALFGGEAGFGGVPAISIEARGGEGFEGALRLRGESGSAAVGIAGREGNARRISER